MGPKSFIQKKIAPLLARYDNTPPSFGTEIKKAIETIKKTRNGGGVKPNGTSAPR